MFVFICTHDLIWIYSQYLLLSFRQFMELNPLFDYFLKIDLFIGKAGWQRRKDGERDLSADSLPQWPGLSQINTRSLELTESGSPTWVTGPKYLTNFQVLFQANEHRGGSEAEQQDLNQCSNLGVTSVGLMCWATMPAPLFNALNIYQSVL